MFINMLKVYKRRLLRQVIDGQKRKTAPALMEEAIELLLEKYKVQF